MTTDTPAGKPSGKNLELLVRCLRRYVELNEERFEIHQEVGQKRIATVFVAKRKPRG